MERRGYTVMRSPQSGGGWDVLAWNEVEVHFIQVKGYLNTRGSYKKDFVKLMAVPPTPHCVKSFWVRKTGQRGWESITTLWTNLPELPEWMTSSGGQLHPNQTAVSVMGT
jgi:hypothetical protein